MRTITVYLVVGMLCLLCSVNGEENEVIEYERSGSCGLFQECLYKYHTVQYSFGKEDRKAIFLSTDVNWHCESSGFFGNQPANEYCFTLSNASVSLSNSSARSANDQDAMATLLHNKLKGEFCYVQTENGKIVSIHYSPTEDKDVVNVKRGITGAFQANFNNQKEVEESDPGSSHISHYNYAKTSNKVVSFLRSFKEDDLIEVTGGLSKDLLDYIKIEKSTFINKILHKSQGTLRIKVVFGNDQNSEPASDTYNPHFDFGDEFQANGTYVLEKAYCKQRTKRSLVFADLTDSNIQKGSLKAVIDLASLRQHRMRELRRVVPSIPEFLEKVFRETDNRKLVSSLRQLVELEAMYGTSSQHTSTINQLIDYYKQIQTSSKQEDIEIRKILYSLFSIDGSTASQKILASALRVNLNEEERDTLLYHLALIKNPNLDLVNSVISNIHSNDDEIILVLGALGRSNNLTIHNTVIDELIQRLNTVLSSGNNEALSTLIYALGNSGSKSAVSSLLSVLQFDDIDIQISAIRSLASHLDQPDVQQAIITLLPLTDENKILEEVLKILIDAYDNKVLINPSRELIDALMNSAVQLANPNLYKLLAKYLQKLKIDEVHVNLDLLRQQQNNRNWNDSRVRRGSDWDENNPVYDPVASYSQRKSDVDNYPHHKSYILGKAFGVDNLKMNIAAGIFNGIYINSSTVNYKFFAKAAAKINVFGSTIDVFDLEVSSYTYGKHLYYKHYLKQGGGPGSPGVVLDINKKEKLSAAKDIAKRFKKGTNTKVETKKRLAVNITIFEDLKTCVQLQGTVDRTNQIFYKERSFYVYVSTVTFYIKGELTNGVNLHEIVCMVFLPSSLNGTVENTISTTLEVTGGAFLPFMDLVKIGIDVGASFTYYIQPVVHLNASTVCEQLYHGWDVNGGIIPYYQHRSIDWGWKCIKVNWGTKHEWNALKIGDSKKYLLVESFC